MKVNITYKGYVPTKEQKSLFEKFIDFLKKSHPLKKDIDIVFTKERYGKMTTGVRTKDDLIKILVKDRLNRDILKTLSHEWMHEYQRTILGRKKGPNIGGKNEDEANAVSGADVKKFEKGNEKLEKIIYKKFQNKIDKIEEGLNVESFNNKLLINEIKKVSIESLPYGYGDLTNFIDSETMKTHYTKHYKGYVDKLNVELEKVKGKDIDLEEIITKISKFNNKVKNNGGGAFNHALFWKMLSPKKQTIQDPIKNEIEKNFGSFEKFKEKFEEESKNRFGSGWVWLILTDTNRLKIVSTSNQDNPLMNTEKERGYPLLGLDVWEHAYYLKYKNKRDDYVKNFWKVVNWGFVNDQYTTRLDINKSK
jgi:Fe-Mn family superoxide dismutase